MKFVDEAVITVQSGRGGNGCVSFRRERFIPRGGPDGGDGGAGGSIVFTATTAKHTLFDFKFKPLLKAENGVGGQGKNKSGRQGEDLIVEVPSGTIVGDVETGAVLKDFVRSGDSVVLARGGRGGRGNAHFKSSTNRAPRFAQPGEPGVTLQLKLELKLLADAGIIGLPNAGKSTLISRISAARPKIADYPFTTLVPNLGVVAPGGGRHPFVVADIPGLIQGAHKGTGLGTRFLKHVERTRLLIHLVDISAVEAGCVRKTYDAVNQELKRYGRQLAAKPQLVVLNKMDLPETAQKAAAFRHAVPDRMILTISAVSGQGVHALVGAIAGQLEAETD